MEDSYIIGRINEEIKEGKKVALAIITKACGSSPRGEGTMMGVREDGKIIGTIGGGALENGIIKRCMDSLRDDESIRFSYNLTEDNGELNMACGGDVEGYIKVLKPDREILIVGGGHISLELHKLSKALGFKVVIFEDREEYCNKERFPFADKLILGDIRESLDKYPITRQSSIVIVTRGHVQDEISLRTVLDSEAGYIGMIGSKKKVASTLDHLISNGASKDKLERVYAPIGLDLGGATPSEIALSILSEIVLCINGGSLKHMRDREKKLIL